MTRYDGTGTLSLTIEITDIPITVHADDLDDAYGEADFFMQDKEDDARIQSIAGLGMYTILKDISHTIDSLVPDIENHMEER